MVAHPLDEDDQIGRYRLDVIAVDVEDAVRFAGGLICDRSLAGWDVFVRSSSAGDDHPLRILGAEVVRELPAPAPGPRPALAVSASVIAADDSVRERVLDSLSAGGADVLVWDAQRAATVPAVLETVEHEVSAAARAYRGQALRAVGVADDGGGPEVFSRTSGRPAAAHGMTVPGALDAERLGHGG